MREDWGHPEILQLQQRAAQHRLDKEDMRRARPGQRPRQPFGAVHRSMFTQFHSLPDLSSRPRKRAQGQSADAAALNSCFRRNDGVNQITLLSRSRPISSGV